MAKRWTKEEDAYLMSLHTEEQDDGQRIPPRIICVLFNDHFKRTNDYAPRTQKAIEARIYVLNDDKSIGRARDYIETRANKTSVRIGVERNSKKTWAGADDKYLVTNWTADDVTQHNVAKHVGRSVQACRNRISRLRRHLPEVYIALLKDSQVTTTVNVLPSNAHYYTLLDRIYIALKGLRKTKSQRKRIKAQKKLDKIEARKAKKQAKINAKIEKLRRELE